MNQTNGNAIMEFPYSQFAKTKLWKAIDKAIADLEKNQDLELTTNRKYVVGYLCKSITDQKSISKTTPQPSKVK